MVARVVRVTLFAVLCGWFAAAFGAIDLVNDDTDIFMINPAVSSARPNVLLMLDNSANWNATSAGVTKRANEMSAIATVVDGLTDQFNLGLGLWVESTGNPSNPDNSAAYIRWGIRQMSGSVSEAGSNKARLASLVTSMTASGNDDQSSSSFVYSLGQYETYAYFKELSPYFGTKAAARDYTGNANARISPYINAVDAGHPALTDNPLRDDLTTSRYHTPITDKCQKNFLIIISNGPDGSAANQQKGLDRLVAIDAATAEISPTTAMDFPNAAGGTSSAIPTSGVWIDEWARYMANHDCGPGTSTTVRPIYTYVIDVDPQTNTTAQKFSALLFNAANNEGKGKYFAVSNNAQAIIDALKAIFNEIQAVNSVFAATTLPVSNNFRGTNLNQVYIGVFRPDQQRKPRWLGNLKMYKVGSNLDQLVDAHSPAQPAYDSVTGFVFNTALSFWTTSSNFWAYRGPGYDTGDVGKGSDLPDGDLVEKGAAGQRLRESYPTAANIAAREVYTCTGSCAAGSLLSATAFSTANADVTAVALKAFTKVALTSLSSSGTTATAVTAAAHGFGADGATVSGIQIDGASPGVFNGTFTVTIVNSTTFTYTLSSAPVADTAIVSATNHGLNPLDTVTVTGASPSGYNVTNAEVSASGFSVNQFDYTMAGSESTAATGYSITGTRKFSAVSGNLSCVSGTTTATASFQNHGFSSSPAGGVTISGSGTAGFNVAAATITVLNANQFSYPMSAVCPSAATSTDVTALATAHGLGVAGATVTGVTIAGSSVSAYNGSQSVTIVDANTFRYTIGSVQTTAANNAGISFAKSISVTGAVALANGSGGSRPNVTATVSGGHGLGTSGTASVTISALSNTTGNNPKFAGTFTATITSSTIFTYTMDCNGSSCPAVNTSLTGTYAASRTLTGTVTSLTPTLASSTDDSAALRLTALVSATSISVQSSAVVSGATAGNTGAGDATLRTAIINWVRGVDNKENENEDTSGTADNDVRASIHGDVLHSRPAVVNYSRTSTDNDVYIYYGTNDGFFRAIKGGTDSEAGKEAWSFIAPEFFGSLQRLRDNSPAISGSNPRSYYFDGPSTVFTRDVDRNSKIDKTDSPSDLAYIYLTMRRGGRMIYALDVSVPAEPKFLWKRGCPNADNDTGCSAGWSELGQTWSEPKLAYIRANDNPVLIFGAGYDKAAEDFQPCVVTSNTTSTVTGLKGGALTYLVNGACWVSGGTSTPVNRTKGRGIFIVDAFTGDIVWRVGPDAGADRQITGMSYAMPSDVSIVNRDRDISGRTALENVNSGFIDRVYAFDTGGNIWRLDIDNPVPSFWAVNKIAQLSESALKDKRKFLYSARLVNDTSCGNFDGIVLGSGDREHPFSAGYFGTPDVNPVAATPTFFADRFFMIKDMETGLINPNLTSVDSKEADLARTTVTVSNLVDLTTDCIETCSADAKAALSDANNRGWYFNLRTGEKTVTSSTVTASIVQFATNQPTGSAGNLTCDSDLGVARTYKVNFCNATAYVPPGTTPEGGVSRDEEVPGGSFLSSPTPAVVCEGSVCKELTCFGPKCGNPVTLRLDERRRTYWYKKAD